MDKLEAYLQLIMSPKQVRKSGFMSCPGVFVIASVAGAKKTPGFGKKVGTGMPKRQQHLALPCLG